MLGLGRGTAVCAVGPGGLAWGVTCPSRDDRRSRSKTAASAVRNCVRNDAYNGYWLHQSGAVASYLLTFMTSRCEYWPLGGPLVPRVGLLAPAHLRLEAWHCACVLNKHVQVCFWTHTVNRWSYASLAGTPLLTAARGEERINSGCTGLETCARSSVVLGYGA
jgi:hypothetical protein